MEINIELLEELAAKKGYKLVPMIFLKGEKTCLS